MSSFGQEDQFFDQEDQFFGQEDQMFGQEDQLFGQEEQQFNSEAIDLIFGDLSETGPAESIVNDIAPQESENIDMVWKIDPEEYPSIYDVLGVPKVELSPVRTEEILCQTPTLTPKPENNSENYFDHQKQPSSSQDSDSQRLEIEPEMLDPVFEESQYVHRDEAGTNAPYTIKIDQLVKLRLSSNLIENQDILVAVYHSHPSFVQETVSGVTAKHIKETAPPNDTPFSIQHDSVIYKDVNFPFLDTKMKAALLTLKSEQHLFIKFLLMSTANQARLKDAKEWHLLIIPLSKTRAEEIRSGLQLPALEVQDCVQRSILRIQIKTEVRKNQKLVKPHRRVEVEWPFVHNLKRKRLESLYIQAKKRKLASFSDEQLEEKIQKYNNAF